MKKLKKSVVFCFCFLLFAAGIISYVHADEYVNGYYRSNGTYVNGYTRSSPDGDPFNNYSYPGNYNPYTGKTATGNPDTYLDDYYKDDSYSDLNDGSDDYDVPTTPDCPVNSSYDGSSCQCDSGYIVSAGSCVSADQMCWNTDGVMSTYNQVTNMCECDSGYSLSNGSCVLNDTICNNQIGYNSNYDSLNNQCECDPGYVIGTSGQCVDADDYCSDQIGDNSIYDSSDNQCECEVGYTIDSSGQCELPVTDNTQPDSNTIIPTALETPSIPSIPVQKKVIKNQLHASSSKNSNLYANFAKPILKTKTATSSIDISTASTSINTSQPWYKKVWRFIVG